MKIAMLTTVGERCGIAAYTRELTAALGTLPETFVETVPITEGRQATEHYVQQAELLNAPDVDVVHIQHEHSFWGGVLPRASAYWTLRYLIQKPVVLTAHTTYTLAELLKLPTERRPHKWLVKRLLLLNRAYRDSVETAPFATAFTIVHTDAARDALVARGAKPAYVVLVPTGIPAPLAAPTSGEAFRDRYRLHDHRAVTIFGYVAPNKGYEIALEALAAWPEDVILVIAGGARTADMEPYLERLSQAVRASGHADRVVITGYLADEDVAEAMEASEIVLVPHRQATGSYSVTLPLTHGRPVIASDQDCFKEIREREDCLELFRSGDPAALAESVNRLLGDAERRAELSANALKYARRFSWPNVAKRTRQVYEAAIRVYSRGHHG